MQRIKIGKKGNIHTYFLHLKSAIRQHIALSILCINAFSSSFCFYWHIFVRILLTYPAMPAKNLTKIRSI